MIYLGAPICDGRVKGGKLIMIRHVLSSIAIYLVAAVAVPKIVLHNINKIITNFFGGSYEGKLKRKWVSWAAICRPVIEGGLGIRRLEDVVSSFRLKNLWNEVVNKSIWEAFLCGKYIVDNISLPGYATPRSASKFWKEGAKLIPELIKNSAWKVGNGDMNFWLENWSNEGTLNEVHHADSHSLGISLREEVEADFIIPGLLEALIPHVRNLYESRLSADTDSRLWSLTRNGIFSVNSAFQQIRETAPNCHFACFYWASFIPKKLSVFFWRAINKVVPVDVRIQDCAISLASGCVCCSHRHIESFDHLFMHSEIATYLWGYFAPSFGIHR
ncbi:Reverse transcriptase zinc-binding domain [Macleaya cordata]|uniref:Reverse transcriptase zinc-binding domain n=1 Tax=Macleaya cordata TaxID=56857 RepID=A0A200R728_MACCD|nr:Reverse transcriptase zinc-binding domain [Macleaya cordata]